MAIAHVGDVGSVIRVTVKENGQVVDLRPATTKLFRILRPDGVVIERNGLTTQDGSDGRVQIVLVDGDLLWPGTYEIQIFLDIQGWRGHTSKMLLEVFPIFSF